MQTFGVRAMMNIQPRRKIPNGLIVIVIVYSLPLCIYWESNTDGVDLRRGLDFSR